jgi:hypothetical protein
MKTVNIISVLLIAASIVSFACKKETVRYPYKFINSIMENSSQVDIYFYSGDLNIEMLKEFCKTKKKQSDYGTSYFIVIFNDEKIAAGIKAPIETSIGKDKLPLKHLRVFFEYNKDFDYSKITWYEKNSIESKPNTLEI